MPDAESFRLTMQTAFAILAALTVVSAIGAMVLRNLVHCALSLAVSLAGMALLFLQLDAQFVGFAQILVYLGAVAILIVFAILLTRGGREAPHQPAASPSWLLGVCVAVLVFGGLTIPILSSGLLHRPAPAAPSATVQQIGNELMTRFVFPLEAVALLLTAALIGAVIIAMPERKGDE